MIKIGVDSVFCSLFVVVSYSMSSPSGRAADSVLVRQSVFCLLSVIVGYRMSSLSGRAVVNIICLFGLLGGARRILLALISGETLL